MTLSMSANETCVIELEAPVRRGNRGTRQTVVGTGTCSGCRPDPRYPVATPVAVAMATHPRLGSASSLAALLRHICGLAGRWHQPALAIRIDN